MLKKLLLSALIAIAPSLALAQAVSWPPPAGAFASLGVYNSSAPVMTTGQVGFLQVDSSGRLITVGSGGGGAGAVTIADGDDVAEGLTTATAATAGGVGSVSAKLRLVTTQLGTLATALSTINTTLGTPLQAGGTAAVQGVVNTTLTDCSGTIASGATAQNAFTASASRHGFTIANIDATEVLWISFTTTAAASGTGSYPLAPATATTFAGLSSFTSPVGMGINTALSVIATTTSHKFFCTVW